MRQQDITLIGIAVTEETDTELLMEIVTHNSTDLFNVDEFEQLAMDEFSQQLETRVRSFFKLYIFCFSCTIVPFVIWAILD